MIVALRSTAAAIALFAAVAGRAATMPAATSVPPLLPMPASISVEPGDFALARAQVAVPAGDAGASAAAARLDDLLGRAGGHGLSRSSGGAIRFVRDAGVAGDEGYRLVVTPAGVTISASGDAGLFYGAETLWQLIASAKDGHIAAVRIDDRPALGWRGLMLDSARHFQPPAYIKQLLDRMAVEKLNVFHWHLADDQGWRLQINHYPRLTDIGAWRVPAGAEGRDPQTGQAMRYGGFYTQAEVRDIVAYAEQRHITIVPEIEMPAHATAAIAAYPELASTRTPPTAPSSDWGILPNLFNTSDLSFTFLENVLDEVMALFPGRYIHVGGDEAPKGQWATDEHVKAELTALGLPNETALQGWFTARIGAYLESHGRRLVGWDEILEGGVPADATVMSWRGMDGALSAARQGHDTILSPAPVFYLDNRQSDSDDEPPGRGEIVDWKRLYQFETSPADLTAEERRHIIGVQVNLWTEYVRTTAYADRMIWPRAAILAEMGWSPAGDRDWAAFAPRLVADIARSTALGWTSDAVPLDAEARAGTDGVTLHQPAGIGTLRVTTDGSTPTPASPAYSGPLPIGRSGDLAAQAFLGDQPLGRVQRWHFDAASLRTRTANAMTACAVRLPVRVEDDGPTDGVRRIHSIDAMRPCWLWPKADLDGIGAVSADVGSIPFNYALGADLALVSFRPPETPEGELEIREDRCDGPRIAVLPLAPAAGQAGVTTLQAPLALPGSGTHDLCITFTQKHPDPLWTIDRLTLIPAARP